MAMTRASMPKQTMGTGIKKPTSAAKRPNKVKTMSMPKMPMKFAKGGKVCRGK